MAAMKNNFINFYVFDMFCEFHSHKNFFCYQINADNTEKFHSISINESYFLMLNLR